MLDPICFIDAQTVGGKPEIGIWICTKEQLREMHTVRVSCRDGSPIVEVATWCLRVIKGLLSHFFLWTLKQFWESPFLPNGWKYTEPGIICIYKRAETLKTSCSHLACLDQMRNWKSQDPWLSQNSGSSESAQVVGNGLDWNSPKGCGPILV